MNPLTAYSEPCHEHYGPRELVPTLAAPVTLVWRIRLYEGDYEELCGQDAELLFIRTEAGDAIHILHVRLSNPKAQQGETFNVTLTLPYEGWLTLDEAEAVTIWLLPYVVEEDQDDAVIH